MAKVLVAEDEQHAREYLVHIFARDGQEVRSAATGREAIDVGTRFRPDVLVADWMLKNHINGLHVAKVLQAINSNLRAILVSGLPPSLYSQQLLASDVFQFFEKPLEIERLRECVRSAMAAPPGVLFARKAKVPGIVEMTPDGGITYANAKVEELFARVIPGKPIVNMSEIFSAADMAGFSRDRMCRVGIGYESGETVDWRVCVKGLGDSGHKLLVFFPEDDAKNIDMESLRMLLGFPEPWHIAWPLKGITLVVDPDPASRRLVLAQMRRVRAKYVAASSADEALQALRDQPRVGLVIVDVALGSASIKELLMEVEARHRGAQIIGSGASDADEGRLREVGVTYGLRKPWGVCDLLDIVTGRL